MRTGFIVSIEEGTSVKEIGKLVEELMKHKYIAGIEGRIVLYEKPLAKSTKTNKSKK